MTWCCYVSNIGEALALVEAGWEKQSSEASLYLETQDSALLVVQDPQPSYKETSLLLNPKSMPIWMNGCSAYAGAPGAAKNEGASIPASLIVSSCNSSLPNYVFNYSTKLSNHHDEVNNGCEPQNPSLQHKAVLIIGARVVGLTLAQSCPQAVIPFEIFESHNVSSEKSQGQGLTLH